MAKAIKISYYKPSDELNIILNEAKDSVLSEISDEIYLRLDPKTNDVLGIIQSSILKNDSRIKAKLYPSQDISLSQRELRS
jgi:hypothetical protein